MAVRFVFGVSDVRGHEWFGQELEFLGEPEQAHSADGVVLDVQE